MTDLADPKTAAMDIEGAYATYRSFLLSLAYRMLGSVAEAEDVVQELFASMLDDRLVSVSHPKAYLTKAVTHRCLNYLKSATKRRVAYVGEWLPEPWIPVADRTLEEIERCDEISYAFLVMLEKLTPLERAVLVLREVFEYEYAEIASILEKTEAACRKTLSRAKKKLGERAAQAAPCRPPGEEQLVQRWVSALTTGDIAEVIELIAEDAVLVTDGGGKVLSAIRPIYGRKRAMALLKAMANRKFQGVRLCAIMVNGAWGLVAVAGERVIGVASFDWNQNGIAQHLYFVFNPDKLAAFDVRRLESACTKGDPNE